MSLIDTVSEVERLSFETVPDIGTGTVVLAMGAKDTLVNPTIVLSSEVIDTFMLAVAGSRPVLVTDMYRVEPLAPTGVATTSPRAAAVAGVPASTRAAVTPTSHCFQPLRVLSIANLPRLGCAVEGQFDSLKTRLQ
ncbi:MAG TPA: hypothetical protein VFV75_16965 [Candidatus Polarisedimenticolaceae bacterium]|nr:hypothetical protein [Candidatus Polarisedimenticolaceae bacterium]